MAGTNLSFPFDEEIFNYQWKQTPDLILTTLLQSGAVVQDSEIANLISNGSNFFNTPYYDLLGGTEQVYNGVNDFTYDTLSGGTYAGCVYGRMKAWSAISFIKDFNSGADPMAQIVNGVAQYWIKARQTRLVGLLTAVFGITGNVEWDKHKTDVSAVGNAQSEKATGTTEPTADGNITVIVTASGMTGSPISVTVAILNADDLAGVATKIATALNGNATISAMFTATTDTASVILTKDAIGAFDSTLSIGFTDTGTTGYVLGASIDNTVATTMADANYIGATSISDATVKACGDNAQGFSLAIMHSVVANKLAVLQLLNYSKYTDASGIQRDLPIGTVNGKTVIVNDNVPVAVSPVEGEFEYTTYVLGQGSIRYASAPVDVPSEMQRDPKVAGGVDMIYTRLRECMTPYGFSFKGDVTTDKGVPDSVFLASASWELKMPAKSIMLARIITN